MRLETKYKILLPWKGWFAKGFSALSEIKYIFYFLAIYYGFDNNPLYHKILGYAGLIYLLICAPLGYLWYKYDWQFAEQEIGNRYNLAWKEVRNFLKKKPLNKRKTQKN